MRRRATIDDRMPDLAHAARLSDPADAQQRAAIGVGDFNSIYFGQLHRRQGAGRRIGVLSLQFFLISFFIGISSGSTVLIGQAYGANEVGRLRAVAGTTLTRRSSCWAWSSASPAGSSPTPILAADRHAGRHLPTDRGVREDHVLYLAGLLRLSRLHDVRARRRRFADAVLLPHPEHAARARADAGVHPRLARAAAVRRCQRGRCLDAGDLIGLVGLLVVLSARNDPLAFDGAMFVPLRNPPGDRR